jgi:DNA-binding Lrp family transcriptional regulator
MGSDMRGLDDIDRRILSLLLEDARRPYSEIAEEVSLSPPAVSDRVQRLQDLGVIERFTLDVNWSTLRDGIPVLVDVSVRPGEAATVKSGLVDAADVDHVLVTADDRITVVASVPEGDVPGLLDDAIGLDAIREFSVDLLQERAWNPGVGDADLAVSCDECGNAVTSEGESTVLDGDRYDFCCQSCRSRFVERYESMREQAQ